MIRKSCWKLSGRWRKNVSNLINLYRSMLLIIDTSKKVAWVALVEEDKIVAEREWLVNQRLGVRLIEVIDELLAAAGEDGERRVPKRIAVHQGPGSYMSLRAGVVTTQLMADQLKCELVGVSSVSRSEMIRQAQLADSVVVIEADYG